MPMQDFVARLALAASIAGASGHAAAQIVHFSGLAVQPSGFVQPPPPPTCTPVPPLDSTKTFFASISDGTVITPEDIYGFDFYWMNSDSPYFSCAIELNAAQHDFSIRQAGWAYAERMRAMARMYELTQEMGRPDVRYLNHLRELIEVALFYRDDHYPGSSDPNCKARCEPTPIDDFRGGHVAGWGSAQYLNLSGIHEDLTGALAYSIATFARIVAEDPSLQAEYGGDAVRYANSAMETMWSLMPQWEVHSVANLLEGYLVRPLTYRTKLTLQVCQAVALAAGASPSTALFGDDNCNNDHDFAGAPLEYNGNAAFTMMLIELWRALDSEFYRTYGSETYQVEYTRNLIPLLVSRFQRFFSDHLQTLTDNADGAPRFYWNYNDGIPHSIHPEDIGHGSLDMQYIGELLRNVDRLNAVLTPVGEPIDISHLWPLANTFLWKIAGGAWSFGSSVFAHDVTGKNPDYTNNSECEGWVNLAAFSGEVYQICRDASLRVVNVAQPLGPAPAPGCDEPTSSTSRCQIAGFRRGSLTIGAHSALLMNKQFYQPPADSGPSNPHCGKYRC